MQDDHTVLVLEDETTLLEAIKAKLQASGFNVVGARTAEQGINYLTDVPGIDAVWLDHYLLGKDSGLEFVAAVRRKEPPLKDIPVFVVSNTASPDKVQAYARLGVAKYYIKSNYRLDEIANDIKNFLK